jgi:hypothetical protein
MKTSGRGVVLGLGLALVCIVGSGQAPSGVQPGPGIRPTGAITNGTVAVFSGTTGRLVGSGPAASSLADTGSVAEALAAAQAAQSTANSATQSVADIINGDTQVGKASWADCAGSAFMAFTAEDATALNGASWATAPSITTTGSVTAAAFTGNGAALTNVAPIRYHTQMVTSGSTLGTNGYASLNGYTGVPPTATNVAFVRGYLWFGTNHATSFITNLCIYAGASQAGYVYPPSVTPNNTAIIYRGREADFVSTSGGTHRFGVSNLTALVATAYPTTMAGSLYGPAIGVGAFNDSDDTVASNVWLHVTIGVRE